MKKIVSISLASVLAVSACAGLAGCSGDNNYPYAIPVNYFYDEEGNFIIFHGSKIGHKVDSLNRNDKVCLTVIGKEEIIDEPWAPYVSNVIK